MYEFGTYRLDAASRTLWRDGQVVPLPPKVAEVLVLLVERSGQVVEKETFLETVWQGAFVEEGNLSQSIFVLRKTLGDRDGASYIETVPKRGYRFAAPIRSDSACCASPSSCCPTIAPAATPVVLPTPAAIAAPPPPRRWFAAAATVVVVLSAALLSGSSMTHSRQSMRIAVLPFENLTGDPAQDFLADGFTESLTGELGRIRSLEVRSRTSAARFKKTKLPASSIGRELNADALVEGSVLRTGNRVRIVCQLIDASSDSHLWSETFDRPIHDIPTLLREVAEQISRDVRLRVSDEDRRRLASRQTVNSAAVEAYFRGRYALEQRTAASVSTAMGHFKKAIEADPSYALAYVGLADSYNQLGSVVLSVKSPAEMRPLAKAAARRALEIDPDLVEAHASLGYSQLYDWEWAGAEQSLKKAIDLNPSYGYARQWWSHYLTQNGRYKEAIQEIYAARELDPLSPVMRSQVGFVLQFSRHYDEAVAEASLVAAAEPEYAWNLWTLGIARISQRRPELAIAPLEAAVRKTGRNPSVLGFLGQAYGMAGRTADARAIARELNQIGATRYVSPMQVAIVHLSLRDDAEFFRWFNKAFEERSSGIAWIRAWSVYDHLRDDPRFKAIDSKVFANVP